MAEAALAPTDLSSMPGKKFITGAVMLATIIQVLDTTIANVALPHMQGSLLATQDQISWVLTSYIVASAIMTLPTGWLAGRYGRKNVLLISVAGFTITSALCGLSVTLNDMVLYRVLQGIFGAALVPLSQATLLDINEPKDHGKAMAVWGMGVMLGPILGPTLGGYLTEYYSWRWVFYINLPLGILSFIGMLIYLPETGKVERPFDKVGFITLSICIACIQLIMDRGQQADWLDGLEIQIYIGLILAAAWMYVIHTMRTKHPFLSPGMLRDRNLQMGLFFIFVVGMILLATMALMPPYMQNIMGYNVLDVGIILAPRGFGTLLSMTVVSRVIQHIDARYLIMLGFGLTAVALNQMCAFGLFVPAQDIVVTGLIQGLGLGFVFIPLSSASYRTLPAQYRAEAASLFSLIRNLGSSIGVSLAFTLFTRNMTMQHAYLTENITPFSTHLNLSVSPETIAVGAGDILRLVDGEITRQAIGIAYINDFRLMMWVVLAMLPCVFLMSKEQKRTAG